MDPFNSARRELLKLSGIGLAAAAATTVPVYAATRSSTHAPASNLFDIRTYGAVGDGKTVYTAAINRADFIAVTAPTHPPAFSLNKVTDLRIAISRAAKDTQLDTADNKTL